MIRIEKSDNPPEKLVNKGAMERDANKALYDADPGAYKTGTKKFDIKSSIYGHKTVKSQLMDEQFEKCCFCEADFTANGYGDVEHFRPKKGYQQKKSDRLKRPGYYWKAYDWDNLFFSCQICNGRHKKNYFPLIYNSKRATCHHDDIQEEQPFIVHPSLDDPNQHIGFREEVPYPKDEKGRKSISAFGLGREKLNDIRREYLYHVKLNYIYAKLDFDAISSGTKDEILSMLEMNEHEARILADKARQFIANAAKRTAPFAAAVRAKYPGLPK
ncbi:MAG: hypothetical protein KAT34_06890 [Candidatus Aminicenantes bacterium]|nr:hypothetical protein [Candidatus Aminicenantes bacterium]